MKHLFIILVLLSIHFKIVDSLECQQWKKESGHAVKFDKFANCKICSMSIIHRNNALHYEAGCYNGPLTTSEECRKDIQNGNEVFLCTCKISQCNSYPLLLERANEFNATQYLKAPLPNLIKMFSVSNSKSHMISNGRIADALAEAGHNVTFLSVEGIIPTKDFPTTKLAKVVILGRIPEERLINMKNNLMELALIEGKETIHELKEGKFDAIFYEQLFPHGASFGHLLGIKIQFLINSCPIQGHITSLFGIPDPTGWVPSVGSLQISDK
uniref:Glucuronosyltransferase n=1 Tax=Panagrolaimus sp. PS1159 TaxID=55785 RepID=A0AC35FK78_9BILA